MALEEDIYEMYREGPFDWFNLIDFMTSTLTGGPQAVGLKKHIQKKFLKQLNNIRTYQLQILNILYHRRRKKGDWSNS